MTSESYPVALRSFYAQKVRWSSCTDGFQCARIKVPISYADPLGSGSIWLHVTKRPASTPKNRLGSLLVNPGGPGGSGIEYAQAADMIVSTSVLDRYDLVGFDPRGVASSAPVKCLSDAQLDTMLAFDATPDNSTEIQRFRTLAKVLGEGCLRNAPTLAKHVDTISAARDMDIIRAILGDTKMTYLGKSYGTFLGATYASLFPKRVGKFVLDGVIDPAQSNVQLSETQAMGFERAIKRFLADCVKRSNCPLKRKVPDAYAQLLSIINKADLTPMPTDDPRRPLTQALMQMGVIFGMYDSTYGWEAERNALRGVVRGDGTDMLSMVDFYLSRESGQYKDNGNEVIAAVNCIDRQDRPNSVAVARYAKAWSAKYPMFGGILAWGLLSCEQWPAPAVGTASPWKGGVVNPILLVGTKYDPATPVEGARALHRQIPKSRLLEWVGDGHTAYRQGSSCVDDVVNRYFLDGALPAKDKVCPS